MQLKKTVVTLATVGVVGLGSALFGNTVYAETLEDIQSERSEVKDNLSDTESKIADVLFDLEEINEQISRVEETLTENKAKMNKTKKKIGKTNEDIESLEDEISGLEDDIAARYEILKDRAISYQKNGGNVSFMDVVLGSSDFSELFSRVSAVSKITDSDQELMEKQEVDKEKVEKKQTKAEDKLAELKDMKIELEGMEDMILAQKKTKKSSKKELKEKENKLTAMKDELEVKDDNLASLESDVRASIEAAEKERQQQTTASASNDSDGDLTTLSKKSKDSSNKNNNSDNNNNNSNNNNVNTDNGGGNTSVINVGKKFIGHSTYVFGAKNPSAGQFDCSGFVSWAYEQNGQSIPRSTAGLSSTGTKVSPSNMQPGDLVFFDTYKRNGHVGIYMGNGQFIGSQTSTGVGIASMNSNYWSQHFNGHVRRVN